MESALLVYYRQERTKGGGTPVAVDSALGMGKMLDGRYRLVSLLGQGGNGAVYLAHDTQLFDRQVAVKELIEQFDNMTERTAAVARFQEEARMLVTLSHPNLPDVRSYFTESGRYYLVMEYIEGSTLLDLLARSGGTLLPEAVADWGRQICEVLAYLHDQHPPVIFRDLKPSNIMLDNHGRIKLIDFGTARHFDQSKHTDTLKMGSIGYAPPEQYQGQGQTSPQTDIYALGVTLHQLLTNVDPSARPFVFTPPSLLRADIPESLSRAIMRAVNLDPSQRYGSAQEMRRALEQPLVEIATTAMLPVPVLSGPNPWLVALFGLIGAGLLELAALAPELPSYGQGTASANWAVDYSVLVGAAVGAALGGILAPGICGIGCAPRSRRWLGRHCAPLAQVWQLIVGVGHEDPRSISLRLLAALALPAAAAGAALLRGLGVGE